MTTQHLPAPWVASPANPEDRTVIEDKNGNLVCFVEGEEGDNHLDFANASRIVACVNACREIRNPATVIKLHRLVHLLATHSQDAAEDHRVKELIARAKALLSECR